MADVGSQHGLLNMRIPDKQALYASYMSFIKNGGLFVPTNKPYKLGDEVFVLVNLVEESERLPVAGRVVWITPVGAQGKRQAGIGIQFSEQDGGKTLNKIETALAGMLDADTPTLTM